MQVIGHGAQATVYKCLQQTGSIKVIKQRLPKLYRHPQLDKKLNESRVKSVNIDQRQVSKDNIKTLQEKYKSTSTVQDGFWIQGTKLKTYLNDSNTKTQEINQILQRLGQLIYRIHELGVIHGDLTTSNMIYKNNQIYLIDFGLSYVKNSIQDRAVDLYVLERAFISTHPQLQKQFNKVLIAYNQQSVLKRLQLVRQRGRKKVAFG